MPCQDGCAVGWPHSAAPLLTNPGKHSKKKAGTSASCSSAGHHVWSDEPPAAAADEGGAHEHMGSPADQFLAKVAQPREPVSFGGPRRVLRGFGGGVSRDEAAAPLTFARAPAEETDGQPRVVARPGMVVDI